MDFKKKLFLVLIILSFLALTQVSFAETSNNPINASNSSNKTMSNEFFKLIYHLFNENDSKKSYSPYPFKEALSKENPLFAGVQANDSKDLINFIPSLKFFFFSY